MGPLAEMVSDKMGSCICVCPGRGEDNHLGSEIVVGGDGSQSALYEVFLATGLSLRVPYVARFSE
jgi:hypothetical protein